MAAAVFDDDFLLETPLARELYHGHAAQEPVFDYHTHLAPADIAQDRRFTNLTDIWLRGDHYKWRAMRANGIPERLITGDGSDYEKFEAWARTVPHTLRNPLFHWTHLELKHPFGIRRWLGPDSAREIYDAAGRLLAQDDFTTQSLLRRFKVAVVCTTDDPTDSLEHHATQSATRMLPTWRPDAALAVESPAYGAWIDRLAVAAGVDIESYDDLLVALDRRHQYFHDHGCRIADHGIEVPYASDYTLAEVRTAFQKARQGDRHPSLELKSALLYELALLNHRRGWAQQLHLGALRNNCSRLLATLGPDCGCDSIGDREMARPLARFLDRLDATSQLARTILYNINPRDNEVFATLIGAFQDGSVPGKLQIGPAWWFLDQLDGMQRQIDALSNLGLLSRFVGMVTDSRSFLSYSRHEYFRRLVCNLIGTDAERGLVPGDPALLGNLVRDLCFRNARDYFGIDLGYSTTTVST